MNLSFGKPVLVTSVDGVSLAAFQQALVCWLATGGETGTYATVNDMLADGGARWFVVCDELGVPVADYWEVAGTALIFRTASTDVVGQATDRGFACCSDVALWGAMSMAQDAPAVVEAVMGSRCGMLETVSEAA